MFWNGFHDNMAFDFVSQQNILAGGGIAASPTEYTMATWIKPKNVGDMSIMCRTDATGTGTAVSHQTRTNSQKFTSYTYDGGIHVVGGTTTYNLNQWYHVVSTAKNSGLLKLYVNGISEGTPSSIGTLWAGGDRYAIGGTSISEPVQLTAELAEFCIWNREFSADEVNALYKMRTRYAPLMTFRTSLVLYLPMNEATDFQVVSNNWRELKGDTAITQTMSGASVTGRSDIFTYP
jgi:hypothetical protein